MFYARPPDRNAKGEPDESCARHGRLGKWLWLLWLAIALVIALVFGHGVASGNCAAPARSDATVAIAACAGERLQWR
ncbi:MAG: hypothetical protein KJZ83_04325 [Burkholderiaceae bacterium]|nr:hypothetical protein [Burkholderiaceae bacterium]